MDRNSQHGERIATWALRICLLWALLNIGSRLLEWKCIPHLDPMFNDK